MDTVDRGTAPGGTALPAGVPGDGWEQAVQAAGWSLGGMGIVLALALLVLLRVALPQPQRPMLRFPLLALAVHVVLGGAGLVIPDGVPGAKAMHLAALLAILLGLARLGFLLVVEVLLGFRRGDAMPRILKDILQGLVYAAALFVALRAAGVAPGSLLTTSALLTAVVGLALQETLGNLVAGLAIQAQRPFDVGDWIGFDADPKHVGQVVEINWRATTVLTQDRVTVVVPNGPLAKSSVTNFSAPTPVVRRSVFVMAPHAVPPARIHEAVLRALGSIAEVLKDPPPSVLTWAFKDNGIEYWIRYFMDRFDQRDAVDGNVRDRVWYALAREGIGYPLPASHVHLHAAAAAPGDEGEAARLRQVEGHLARVDFLRALPAAEVARLARRVATRSYGPGEQVIREGATGAEMFLVLRGQVRVLVLGQEVARLPQGAFFGEMSLLTGEPRAATVEACGDLEAIVVGHAAFRELLEGNPAVAEVISHTVASRQQVLDKAHEAGAGAGVAAHRSSLLLEKIKGFFSLG